PRSEASRARQARPRDVGAATRRRGRASRICPSRIDDARDDSGARRWQNRHGARTTVRFAPGRGSLRMKIVAAIHDLMFSSKVNAAAQGKPISWVPRGTPPAEYVAKEKADVLLIDLDAHHFDAIEAVRAVKAADPKILVIGYVGHEKAD